MSKKNNILFFYFQGQSELEEPLPPGEEKITELEASPPKIMKVESGENLNGF